MALRKKLFGVALALALTALVAGCGGSESSDDGDGKSSGTSTAAASVPFSGSTEEGLPVGYDEPERGDLTIGFSNPLDADEAVHSIARAVKLETERLGGTFINQDSKGDPDAQVTGIEQLIAQKVDAIVAFPLDARALDPVLRRAEEAGIPVVAIEADTANQNPPGYASQIWMRRDHMAYLQAQDIASKLEPGAKVAVMGFAVPVPSIERLVDREKYWAEQFGLEVVGRVDNPSNDIAGGDRAMTELLAQHPDVQGVIAYNEDTAVGAASAARAQGKRDIAFVGVNGGSLGYSSVKDGKISATVQIQTHDLGRQTVWAAYLAAAGRRLPPTVLTPEPKVINSDTVDDVPNWDATLTDRYGKTE